MTGPARRKAGKPPFRPHPAVVDIELTSRCNAKCTFCPRDETPHQGLIDEATLDAAVRRVVEYRDAILELGQHRPGDFEMSQDTIAVTFCGMGEPLVHPRAVEYVGRVVESGLRAMVSTNASLLHPGTADALLDAGLTMAFLNVGDIGERYEAVYGLPFERTRENVEHFLAASRGRCVAAIVLVDHDGDPERGAAAREYWAERGAHVFAPFGLVNRAGALAGGGPADAWETFLPEAERRLEGRPGAAGCTVPFLYPFVGYDGSYYLCSSDWRKEVALGNVFEHRLVDILDAKAAYVCSPSAICRTCTHDPLNAVARSLANDDPGTDQLLARMDHFAECAAAMRAHLGGHGVRPPTTTRRLIPVRS